MGRGLASGGRGGRMGANRKSPRAVCTYGVYAAPCDPSRLRRPPTGTTPWWPAPPAATTRPWTNCSRRYRDPAYRVAYRLLGNAEDALDAVQDGFIKALTHLPPVRGPVLVQDVAVAGGQQRGPGPGPAAAAAGRAVRGRDRARGPRRRGHAGPPRPRPGGGGSRPPPGPGRGPARAAGGPAADVRPARGRRTELPRGGRGDGDFDRDRDEPAVLRPTETEGDARRPGCSHDRPSTRRPAARMARRLRGRRTRPARPSPRRAVAGRPPGGPRIAGRPGVAGPKERGVLAGGPPAGAVPPAVGGRPPWHPRPGPRAGRPPLAAVGRVARLRRHRDCGDRLFRASPGQPARPGPGRGPAAGGPGRRAVRDGLRGRGANHQPAGGGRPPAGRRRASAPRADGGPGEGGRGRVPRDRDRPGRPLPRAPRPTWPRTTPQ